MALAGIVDLQRLWCTAEKCHCVTVSIHACGGAQDTDKSFAQSPGLSSNSRRLCMFMANCHIVHVHSANEKSSISRVVPAMGGVVSAEKGRSERRVLPSPGFALSSKLLKPLDRAKQQLGLPCSTSTMSCWSSAAPMTLAVVSRVSWSQGGFVMAPALTMVVHISWGVC